MIYSVIAMHEYWQRGLQVIWQPTQAAKKMEQGAKNFNAGARELKNKKSRL